MLSLPWCFLYYTAHGLCHCHTLWSKYFIQLFLQLILIIFMVLLPKGLNVHRLFICNKIMHILYWVYLFPCSPCQSLDSWVTSYPVGGNTKVAKWKNHEAEQKNWNVQKCNSNKDFIPVIYILTKYCKVYSLK